MKRISLMIVAAGLLATTVFTSCKKDGVKANINPVKGKNTMRNPDPFVYYNYGVDITEADIISNPEDVYDENYNKVEFALSLCMVELYNNHPSKLQALIQNVDGTQNKCFNLFTYADQDPSVNAIFNTIFASRFNDFSSYGNNWKTYVEAKYKYNQDHYIPFAMFANRGSIDLSLAPYVAAPFEIDEEKFPNFDDNIPLWVKNANATLFSTLNLENAEVIENPILLVTNGAIGDETAVYASDATGPVISNPPPACPPWLTQETLSHKKFRLGVRYDRTGKSEYKFCYGTTVGFEATTMSFINKYSGGYHFANGMKVKKSDVGKLLTFDFVIYNNSTYPSYPTPLCFAPTFMYATVYETMAVGAFEFDWYSGRKIVYSIKNAGGATIDYKDRRKFKHEWYYLDPATNNSYEFPVRNPTPNSLYTNTTKGELQLLRWY